MKYGLLSEKLVLTSSRAPQGARGLKSDLTKMVGARQHVAPRKGRVG